MRALLFGEIRYSACLGGWEFVGMGWGLEHALGVGTEIGEDVFHVGDWDWDRGNQYWA